MTDKTINERLLDAVLPQRHEVGFAIDYRESDDTLAELKARVQTLTKEEKAAVDFSFLRSSVGYYLALKPEINTVAGLFDLDKIKIIDDISDRYSLGHVYNNQTLSWADGKPEGLKVPAFFYTLATLKPDIAQAVNENMIMADWYVQPIVRGDALDIYSKYNTIIGSRRIASMPKAELTVLVDAINAKVTELEEAKTPAASFKP